MVVLILNNLWSINLMNTGSELLVSTRILSSVFWLTKESDDPESIIHSKLTLSIRIGKRNKLSLGFVEILSARRVTFDTSSGAPSSFLE